MKWILIYTFLLASGETVEAEMPAADPARHTPVRSLAHCERIAQEQAFRMLQSFDEAQNRVFADVHIRCERKVARRRP